MNFSEAFTLLKAGHKICRAKWDEVDMNKCIELDNYSPFRKPNVNVHGKYPSQHSIKDYSVDMEEMLAEDWEIFKGPYHTTTRLEDGLHRFEIKSGVDDYTTFKQEHAWKEEHPNFTVAWYKGDPIDGTGKKPIALIEDVKKDEEPFKPREGVGRYIGAFAPNKETLVDYIKEIMAKEPNHDPHPLLLSKLECGCIKGYETEDAIPEHSDKCKHNNYFILYR